MISAKNLPLPKEVGFYSLLYSARMVLLTVHLVSENAQVRGKGSPANVARLVTSFAFFLKKLPLRGEYQGIRTSSSRAILISSRSRAAKGLLVRAFMAWREFVILSTFASPDSFVACQRARSSAGRTETADVLQSEQSSSRVE